MDRIDEFHMAQYKRLTEQISAISKSIEDTNRYLIFGLAVFYGWTFSKKSNEAAFVEYTRWLPPVLILAFIV
jgi:hypothetical protein